jgi:hypothetical protein
MPYRYAGRAGWLDKKNGKARRQVDADTRKGESTVRFCQHSHTDNGWNYVREILHYHKH